MNNQLKNSKVTILDVAKHANVSISVVSNVLNHPDKVAESTIRRVKRSMEVLGWFPNIRRRGPKNIDRLGIRTGNLALLFLPTRPSQLVMTGPTNTELVYSMVHEANALGFTISILDADPNFIFDVDHLKRYYDGVLIFGYSDDQNVLNCLARISANMPTVWLNRKCTAPNRIDCDYVYYDNSMVGPLAAEYFVNRNHRDVAVFTVSMLHYEFVDRINTFLAKTREFGISAHVYAPDPQIESTHKYSFWDIAHAIAREYVAKSSASALFFCSDDCLLAVTQELRNLGVDISKLDLVSCNHNLRLLQYFRTQPVSIDIRFEEIGTDAVRHLLKIINGKVIRSGGEFLVQPRLPQ